MIERNRTELARCLEWQKQRESEALGEKFQSLEILKEEESRRSPKIKRNRTLCAVFLFLRII